ncbi:hypothetical protein ACFL6N_06170 [Thermodesulfobacteriota bacterium]
MNEIPLILDPIEYNKRREATVKKFTAGASEHFMRGFMDDALHVQQKHEKAFQKQKKGELQSEWLEKGSQSFDTMLNRVLEDGEQDTPKVMRNFLSALQKEGEEYGLTKAQVSTRVIQSVGIRAVNYGRPDLLKFAWEEDNGIKLIATDAGPQVESYFKQALAAQKAMKAQGEKAVEKSLKGLTNSIEVGIVEALEANDLKKAQTLLHNSSDGTRNKFGVALDASKVEHYHKMLNDFRAEEGYADEGTKNDDVYLSMYNRAMKGELDPEYLAGFKGQLTRGMYLELFKRNSEATAKGLKGLSEMDKAVNQYIKDRASVFVPDLLEKSIDRDAARRRKAMYPMEFDRAYREWQKNNSGKEITYDELYKVGELAEKAVTERYRPMFEMKGTSSSSDSSNIEKEFDSIGWGQ